MAELKINPYNFVPLPRANPERGAYRGLHRVGDDGLSGVLVCELEVLTPLFTADHQGAKPAGGEDSRKIFPFLRNAAGTPILQGTSIKGMVRSVYEALTNSCLCLASPVDPKASKDRSDQKEPEYDYAPLEAHDNSRCNALESLCPACRLFGTIQGDEVHVQGRVAFADATLSSGELVEETVRLRELSSPKPRHAPIYGSNGQRGDPIAGRKLYYHHDPERDLVVSESDWSSRATAIAEYAPKTARFRFQVRLQDLDDEELTRLLWCLELEPDLAHKLGMAKPLGYGSCRIRLLDEESSVERGAARYRQWGPTDKVELETCRGESPSVPKALREPLRWEKHLHADVGYLSWKGYQGVGINSVGEFQPVDPRRPPRADRKAPGVATLGDAGVGLAKLLGGRSHTSEAQDEKSEPQRFKVGDKVKIEVLSGEANRYRLLIRETGQEIEYEHMGVWEPGQRLRMKVKSVDPKGRITGIRP